MQNVTFSDGVCGSDDCNNEGSLLCSSCRLVEYCGSACQKRDWKQRHKTECKSIKCLNPTSTGINSAKSLEAAILFYERKPEYIDRDLNVKSLLIRMVTGGNLASVLEAPTLQVFMILDSFCRCLVRRYKICLVTRSAAVLECYIKDANSCLAIMRTKSPTVDELRSSQFLREPSLQESLTVFNAKILFAEAKVMLFKSCRTEAEALCDQAIDLVKTQLVNVQKRVELLSSFCSTLGHFQMREKMKSVFEYNYCVITETSGPADPRLPKIIDFLSLIMGESGDLETAEHYSRTALENIKNHGDMTDIRVIVENHLSLGRILLQRCQAICKEQEEGIVSGTPSPKSSAVGLSAFTALVEEAGTEFKSAVSFCDRGGQAGENQLGEALNALNRYYLLCGFTGEDVEESMWRAVRLDPELYRIENKHNRALVMLAHYYRQQCNDMGSKGTTEGRLERLLELRRLALSMIGKVPDSGGSDVELSLSPLHNVVDTVAKPYMRLSLWGRSILSDPKAYMVAADDAIRRWQELPAMAMAYSHNATKLEEARRLSHIRQEIAVMVSIALACFFMSADGHQLAYRRPGAIIWKEKQKEKGNTSLQSEVQGCGDIDNTNNVNRPVSTTSTDSNHIGDTERWAIYTTLNPRANDLLRCALRLCQDNFRTETALISKIAGYLNFS